MRVRLSHTGVESWRALTLGCHSIRVRYKSSRSASKDDPFGERSSWEDPQGIGLRNFDEAAFATAAASSTAQGKHFGPHWAKFSTVGKLAVEAMSSSNPQRKTSEELHEADVLRSQSLLRRNFQSYSDFVAAELGGGENRGGSGEARTRNVGGSAPLSSSSVHDDGAGAGTSPSSGRPGVAERKDETPFRDAAEVVEAMEAAVFSTDPNVAGYRVVQIERRSQRLAVGFEEAEEADGLVGDTEATLPLPSFYRRPPSNDTENGSDTTVGASASLPTPPPEEGVSADGEVFSTADPLHWSTDDVLLWLDNFAEPGVMDDSLRDAFRMMHVTGEMLLNRVQPNELFKVMRRWHLKRKAAREGGMPATMDDLRSFVGGQVGAQLIQETIYLCYPYCR